MQSLSRLAPRFFVFCCFLLFFAVFIVLNKSQHLHAMGGKAGLKAAAKAKADFSKAVISRIEDAGNTLSCSVPAADADYSSRFEYFRRS